MQFWASSLWLPGVCGGGAGKNKEGREVQKKFDICIYILKKMRQPYQYFKTYSLWYEHENFFINKPISKQRHP